MFYFQPTFFSQLSQCTEVEFSLLVQSDNVNRRISEYRKRRAEIEKMKNEGVQDAVVKTAEQEAAKIKRGLPGITFQATFEESLSKNGHRGVWRKQSAAHLNGLFVCDFDHIDDPKGKFEEWVKLGPLFSDKILLVFITASGKGLKVVGKADVSDGNIIDNARKLAATLGMETDESCKDASRLSFCPGKDDILFLNNELFTYENKEFEETYGSEYRSNLSAGHMERGAASGRSKCGVGVVGSNGSPNSGQSGASDGCAQGAAQCDGEGVHSLILDKDENGNYTYRGVKYADIIEALVAARGGYPTAGGRHLFTLQLASDLRYICDNNKEALVEIILLSRSAKEIEQERGRREIEDIAASATGHNMLNYMPKRLRTALESVGIRTAGSGIDAADGKTNTIDYQYWWKRLEPLLGPGLAEAVAPFRDEIKLGGVLAAGAMFGSYLTKCWWEHYDGERRRMSFLVYIVGDAASGKSFIIDLDRNIMSCLRYNDKIGRDWEREYKEDKARRATSRKDQGKEAQEIKHPVIRIVPSTISNAMFYRRSMDAVAEVGGEEMHLHLYTMESELSTALRAQIGSWAGKLDLECKSFQNEYAGVDYANEQSVNGLIQVNWNQVVSGTMDAMRRKITPSTVLDGLVTRLALFVMPSNDFTMIDRKKVKSDRSREEALKTWGFRLDKLEGNLPCERLVETAYKWCADKAETAKFEGDKIMDYFRKRVPMYMVRYGLVRAVLRQYDTFVKTGNLEIDDKDVEFAELIGDYLLYIQQYMYGQQIEEALEVQNRDFRPRQRKSRFVEIYAQLPNEFSIEDLVQHGYKQSSASTLASRLKGANIIEAVGKSKWRKLTKDVSTFTFY